MQELLFKKISSHNKDSRYTSAVFIMTGKYEGCNLF
jgi:hypothetical protein